MTISTEPGQVITDVSTGDATPPSGFIFPFGTIGYTTTSPFDGSVTMTFDFSADLPDPLTIFKVDNNGGNPQELPTNIWNKVDANTVTVTVTDGDPLTDTGPVDGSIVDPIAVAGQQASGGDVFDFGGNGCSISNTRSTSMDPIWLFMLLAPGLGILRRRVAATATARVKDS